MIPFVMDSGYTINAAQQTRIGQLLIDLGATSWRAAVDLDHDDHVRVEYHDHDEPRGEHVIDAHGTVLR